MSTLTSCFSGDTGRLEHIQFRLQRSSHSDAFLFSERLIVATKQNQIICDRWGNAKPYQQRRTRRNTRKIFKKKGYLQVDKMKLRHGVVWDTITGKVVDLANNILDMDTMICWLLSEKSDKVEAVVYMNQ